MLIRVRYSAGRIEQVPPRKLQKLIDTRRIIQFMRSGGWVTVGFDPIRSENSTGYVGPERRN
ncbi:MAG: hypothetical protein KAT62_04005 [Desulfuromonadales bacterium]|nr:hypothetical protein [Desulfuromonadales bacterium]